MEISESEVDLELKSRFESAEDNKAVHKMLSSFFETNLKQTSNSFSNIETPENSSKRRFIRKFNRKNTVF